MGGDNPLPLSEYELLSFPPPMGPEVDAVAVPAAIWSVGDRVVVIEGVFQGSEGTVTAVDDERLRLTIEAMVFDRMGIDTNEVVDGMNTKWNALGFRPGLVGGHCIGVDPYYFTYEAEKLGYHSQIILNGRIVV